jgi:PPOX class probable F420-dependent enzyme
MNGLGLDPRAYHMFDGRNVGCLSTYNEDGSIHCTLVWVDRDGGCPLVNSREGRHKIRNLERDPRLVLTVVAVDDIYRSVQVNGSGLLDTTGAGEHLQSLSQRYLGKPYPWADECDKRLIIRITGEFSYSKARQQM